MIIKPLANTNASTETDSSIAHVLKKHKTVTQKEMFIIANAHRQTASTIFILKYQHVKNGSSSALRLVVFYTAKISRCSR
jgi:hypothetical protein